MKPWEIILIDNRPQRTRLARTSRARTALRLHGMWLYRCFGRKVFLSLWVATLVIPIAGTAQAPPPTSGRQADLEQFFKDAVRSTPNVEYFLTSIQNLPPPASGGLLSGLTSSERELSPPSLYEGKWSAGRYVMSIIITNVAAGRMLTNVVGRSADSPYYVNANTLSLAAETEKSNPTNLVRQYSDATLGIVEQFFNMGIGDVHPESIVWTGNEFDGQRGQGIQFHGRLVSSNGVPWELNLSTSQEGEPYKKCRYDYPSPRDALGGYPARTVVWTKSSEGLTPHLELKIIDLRMARSPLPDSAFEPSLYVTPNTLYTTITSNGATYLSTSNGQMIEMKQ